MPEVDKTIHKGTIVESKLTAYRGRAKLLRPSVQSKRGGGKTKDISVGLNKPASGSPTIGL